MGFTSIAYRNFSLNENILCIVNGELKVQDRNEYLKLDPKKTKTRLIDIKSYVTDLVNKESKKRLMTDEDQRKIAILRNNVEVLNEKITLHNHRFRSSLFGRILNILRVIRFFYIKPVLMDPIEINMKDYEVQIEKGFYFHSKINQINVTVLSNYVPSEKIKNQFTKFKIENWNSNGKVVESLVFNLFSNNEFSDLWCLVIPCTFESNQSKFYLERLWSIDKPLADDPKKDQMIDFGKTSFFESISKLIPEEDQYLRLKFQEKKSEENHIELIITF